MKKVLFLIAVQVLLTLGSCTRHCAGFSDEMRLQYFPYSKGQELAFVNNVRDTLLFQVTDVSVAGPYNLAWNVKEDCAPEMRVKVAANINGVDWSVTFMFIASYADDLGDESNWVPTDMGTGYMSVVYSEVSNDFRSNDYLCHETTGGLLRSLMDTLHFSCDSHYPDHYTDPHLDSLVVVRNKGLISFSFSLPDGQKYLLSDMN